MDMILLLLLLLLPLQLCTSNDGAVQLYSRLIVTVILKIDEKTRE